MSDDSNGNPPLAFWIISGLFLTWNLIGLMFYLMQVTMTPETMAENFSDAQVALMMSTPAWATAGYATAVNAGVLVQDFDAFVLSDVIAVWGTNALYLPTVVIIICVAEIWYSHSIANRYYR